MSVIAVIPARWGSRRFPGKPLVPIHGKPLVQHVWERCAGCRSLDRVIVATDDKRIYNAVTGFGGEALMTPKTCATGTDRIAAVARKIKAEYYLNIQGDGPGIEKNEITACVRAVKKAGRHEIVTNAAVIKTRKQWLDPNVVKVICDHRGYALYFSRAPIPAVRGSGWPSKKALAHQSIYAYSRSDLLEYVRLKPSIMEKFEKLEMLRALQAGWKFKIVTGSFMHPEVDCPADLAAVKICLWKKMKN